MSCVRMLKGCNLDSWLIWNYFLEHWLWHHCQSGRFQHQNAVKGYWKNLLKDKNIVRDPGANLIKKYQSRVTTLFWRFIMILASNCYNFFNNTIQFSIGYFHGLEQHHVLTFQFQDPSLPSNYNYGRRRSRAVLYQLSGHYKNTEKSKTKKIQSKLSTNVSLSVIITVSVTRCWKIGLRMATFSFRLRL